jgi:excisionase family DNA binding protein
MFKLGDSTNLERTMSNRNLSVQSGCLVIGVPEAGAMLGLNRNAAYAAAKRGDIPTIRFGKLIRVPKAAFERMLQEAGVR